MYFFRNDFAVLRTELSFSCHILSYRFRQVLHRHKWGTRRDWQPYSFAVKYKRYYWRHLSGLSAFYCDNVSQVRSWIPLLTESFHTCAESWKNLDQILLDFSPSRTFNFLLKPMAPSHWMESKLFYLLCNIKMNFHMINSRYSERLLFLL